MRQERSVSPRRPRPALEKRTYVAPHYHSRILSRLVFIVLILLLVVVIGVAGGMYWSLTRPQGSGNRPITFQVASGDTVSSIATRLQRKGLIDNTLLFHLDARLQDLGGNLKAGVYTLRPGMSIQGMVMALQHYTSPTIRITIREGLRKEQIAAILQKHGINGKQFLRAVEHPTFHLPVMRDKPRGAGLEGYLYPNTYEVAPHYNGALFAKLMVQTLSQVFTPGMQARAMHTKLGIYGVLKLASIVEREARMPSERRLIASVYHNRLTMHPPILNADPTVQYAVGHRGDWWPTLTSGQEDAASPYNSYTHAGLPPTPICNPGLASIKAALSPASTHYLFFVAKGNGYHAFATTLAQQQANIARYSQP